MDEELLTWGECLHRYDKLAQEIGNTLKPSTDSIIAAMNKLYSYKTINYTKKMRVTLVNLLIFPFIEKKRYLILRL